ncbi:MAG: GDSL-type esterase/lipase family protein [Patescibacteria group bacterium]
MSSGLLPIGSSDASASVGPFATASDYWASETLAGGDMTAGNSIVALIELLPTACGAIVAILAHASATTGWELTALVTTGVAAMSFKAVGGSTYQLGAISPGLHAIAITATAAGPIRSSMDGFTVYQANATNPISSNSSSAVISLGNCVQVASQPCKTICVLEYAHIAAEMSDAELVAASLSTIATNRYILPDSVRSHASLTTGLSISRDWNGVTSTITPGGGIDRPVFTIHGSTPFNTIPEETVYEIPQAYWGDNALWQAQTNYVLRNQFARAKCAVASGATNTSLASSTTFASGFSSPVTDVCWDGNNFYAVDYTSNDVKAITPAGVVTTFATGLSHPYGICWAGNNFYATSGNTIVQITPGGVVTTFASGFATPIGICWDGSNFYVSNYSGNNIKKITPAAEVTTFASVTTARWVIWDGSNFYAISGTTTIVKITPAGVVSTVTAGLIGADAMCWDGTNFYVTSNSNGIVYRVSPAGVVTIALYGLGQPYGISFLNGSMYACDGAQIIRIKLLSHRIAVDLYCNYLAEERIGVFGNDVYECSIGRSSASSTALLQTADYYMPATNSTIDVVDGTQTRNAPPTIWGTFVRAVRCSAGVLTCTRPMAPMHRVVIYQDSISWGYVTVTPFVQSWGMLLRSHGLGAGWDITEEAYGTRALTDDVTSNSHDVDATKLAALVGRLASACDGISSNVLIVAMGTNDCGHSLPSGYATRAIGFGILYAAFLDAFHALRPDVQIVCITPLTRAVIEADLVPYRSEIVTDVTDRSAWGNVTTMDGPSMVTYPANFTDGTHPNDAGHVQFEAAVRAVLGY